jgi:HSP20 family molecular chaperone IbpA
MFKRKCPNCAKKIEKKFNFCPYCGLSFKRQKEEEDFGMLGKDDFFSEAKAFSQEISMPLGMNKIMNSLIKQLNREMGGGLNGFKIQISTGKPKIKEEQPRFNHLLSEEEIERRKGLPKIEAESNVRRMSESIIYEISVPGVKSKDDISINNLETGIEIRAYSRDFCYIKTIPLKVEVLGYRVKSGMLFLELKG